RNVTGVQTCALPIFYLRQTLVHRWPAYFCSLGLDAAAYLSTAGRYRAQTSRQGMVVHQCSPTNNGQATACLDVFDVPYAIRHKGRDIVAVSRVQDIE